MLWRGSLMFDFLKYRKQYLDNYLKNGYQPIVDTDTPIILTGTKFPRYDIIGIHHLTPSENVGKHNLFIDIINRNNDRIMYEQIEWGWEGQRPNEVTRPLVLDKPTSEPSGNIALGSNQTVWAKVLNKESDTVVNIHTRLPDEGSGNTIGHHSFYIVWLYTEDDGEVKPPPVDPPVEGCEELENIIEQLRQENYELRNKLNDVKEVLGC